jgi:choice-of-anchor B domain-containing protein
MFLLGHFDVCKGQIAIDITTVQYMKIFSTFCFLLMTYVITAQTLNTTLVGAWAEGTVEYNDCWGYVDPAGNEYALIGSLTKLSVISCPIGGTPVKVGDKAPGSSSIWRDIKTYGTYMYSTADQGAEGLTIINLATLPASITYVGQLTTHFIRAHNLYIDVANARLYVVGANSLPGKNGMIVYSLANPAAPTLIGQYALSGGYIHEIHVKNNIAYASSEGRGLYIYNCANINATTPPVELGNLDGYPFDGYNHSGWLSSDNQRFVFADETYGTKLKFADVSNPAAPSVNTNNVFRQCLIPTDSSCIPHNPFIKGNLCYVAYYHDGLVVFNISNPTNITRVAYFDSYTSNTNYSGYHGAWGTYPFLPSNRILVSDIETGLKLVNITGALPVDLLNFRGKLNKNEINLSWETEAELNHKQFEIERSNDGITWEQLGTKEGNGNTSYLRSYRFTDSQPFQNDNYYRLRQVDYDGNSDLSQVIHVRVQERDRVISVFPTLLTEGMTSIQLEAPISDVPMRVTIADLQGKLIEEMQIPSSESVMQHPVNVQSLAKGIYILTAWVDGLPQTVKLVK